MQFFFWPITGQLLGDYQANISFALSPFLNVEPQTQI